MTSTDNTAVRSGGVADVAVDGVGKLSSNYGGCSGLDSSKRRSTNGNCGSYVGKVSIALRGKNNIRHAVAQQSVTARYVDVADNASGNGTGQAGVKDTLSQGYGFCALKCDT